MNTIIRFFLITAIINSSAIFSAEKVEKEYAAIETFKTAVKTYDIPAIEASLAKGVSVETEITPGESALVYAVSQPGADYKDVVKVLLAHKAHVNGNGNPDNQTPLMAATAHRQYKTMIRLLDHKANVNQQDTNGKTALMIASDLSTPLVRILLEGGAQVNLKDRRGETPLMHAVLKTDKRMTALLLAYRADCNLTDTIGRGAYSRALGKLVLDGPSILGDSMDDIIKMLYMHDSAAPISEKPAYPIKCGLIIEKEGSKGCGNFKLEYNGTITEEEAKSISALVEEELTKREQALKASKE